MMTAIDCSNLLIFSGDVLADAHAGDGLARARARGGAPGRRALGESRQLPERGSPGRPGPRRRGAPSEVCVEFHG